VLLARRDVDVDGSRDDTVAAAVDHIAARAAAARTDLNRVSAETDEGIQALAPSLETCAGKTQLATYLQQQLGEAREVLASAKTEDGLVGNTLRAAAAGYHPEAAFEEAERRRAHGQTYTKADYLGSLSSGRDDT